jgi:16S rRNA (guanine(527)-N(7))-methyltransferase RsmG
MRDRLLTALKENQSHFGIAPETETLALLADYFDLVMRHNALLHLVGPCSPEDFAVRHILESIVMTEFIPTGGSFADVGAGAGLPSIPCLIARPDLSAVLIESKPKKAAFLESAAGQLGIAERVRIINKQFAETRPPEVDFIACRALDGFLRRLPQLVKWAGPRGILFFGGPETGDSLRRLGRKVEARLLPLSERRFLFICLPRRQRHCVQS